ncbi:MAG: hypothetical protein ABSG35_01985 [Syntrophobacteraceae bacterium]
MSRISEEKREARQVKILDATTCCFAMKKRISIMADSTSTKERGHTYTPDNGVAVRLVAAQEMKQSKSVGMLERELGA